MCPGLPTRPGSTCFTEEPPCPAQPGTWVRDACGARRPAAHRPGLLAACGGAASRPADGRRPGRDRCPTHRGPAHAYGNGLPPTQAPEPTATLAPTDTPAPEPTATPPRRRPRAGRRRCGQLRHLPHQRRDAAEACRRRGTRGEASPKGKAEGALCLRWRHGKRYSSTPGEVR